MNLPAALAAWGPEQPAAATPAQAAAHCAALAWGHYENFPVLSAFVAKPLRPHFAAVYAYCRWADDLADESGAEAPRLLTWWRRELEACFAGEARHPVFVALAPTIREFALPPEPFRRLLDAFDRDQTQTRYADHAEVLTYCRCSADPVGELVLRLYRQADDEKLALSSQVCTGLQLANFCQDISRDADKGRIYLPQSELRTYGVSDAEVLGKIDSPACRGLVAAEVARAEEYLDAGAALTARLSGRSRWTIALFAAGGLAVCRKIRRTGSRTLTERPKLGKADAPWLLWTAARLSRNRR